MGSSKVPQNSAAVARKVPGRMENTRVSIYKVLWCAEVSRSNTGSLRISKSDQCRISLLVLVCCFDCKVALENMVFLMRAVCAKDELTGVRNVSDAIRYEMWIG